jgi:hypothetical protein
VAPEPTVGVAGFGRCGSSLTMRMLHAGGLPPVPGSSPTGYEIGFPLRVVPEDMPGRAVKVLETFMHEPMPTPPGGWRFVWLDRNPLEQAKSQRKMVEAIGLAVPYPTQACADSLIRDRPKALEILRALGPVTVLTFEDILANPAAAAYRLRRKVWPGLDARAAARQVIRRSPLARADFHLEASLNPLETS